MSDEQSNHYTELRAVYGDLIDRREDLKAEEGHNSPRAGELLAAIQAVEELLREWNKRDDRDGSI